MLEEVRTILGESLQLGARARQLQPKTPLLGNLPELDSLAVVNVITAIEEHYGVVIDDDELSADIFRNLGSLTAFVEDKVNGGG
ncbi:MAG TPA: acyl carrier protein [Gammaproteobacteria bacterium]|nr:acyl carrier protein [Gammaproteobacteria bacterium]